MPPHPNIKLQSFLLTMLADSHPKKSYTAMTKIKRFVRFSSIMFFLPLLAEQHFWKKNYEYFAGKQSSISHAINSSEARAYLEKVSKNMQTYNAADAIYRLKSQ